MTTTQRKYPWEKWFRPGRHTLVKGVDFQGSAKTLCRQFRQRAIGKEIHLSIKVNPDCDVVTVTVTPRPTYVEAVHDPFEDVV